MKRILVTGAGGQLGMCLRDAVQATNLQGYDFLFVNREQFDICNRKLVESWFFSNRVDVVVNCAAYTAVDKAEDDVENAFLANADAVGLLAAESAEQGAFFVHVSTDYVFNGMAVEPFVEDDYTQPLNVYGKSKLEGERLAMEKNTKTVILRTAWVYSQYGKNFLKTMLRLFAEKDEISVVQDQRGTPTNANDIAKAILKIILTEKKTPGVFHFTNAGATTWYGFAEAIKEFTESKITIHPIASSSYPTPAQRPQYSVLDTSKIKETYDVEVRDWKESLKELLGVIER
ncbi:MAG: dTDP-4-dehydrorhamnose reductase [Flavobacteriaceae bacterium]|nr:dTDP-4-dehydrorhamnose reductase [Flavobacteriaceae bacterium]